VMMLLRRIKRPAESAWGLTRHFRSLRDPEDHSGAHGDGCCDHKAEPSNVQAHPQHVGHSVGASKYIDAKASGDDKYLETILARNAEWAEETMRDDPAFFEHLSKGQSPQYLWIGCSDSRVPANQLIAQPPGSVFVHRNVANMVVNTDVNLMSVIQYAVTVLDVKHIMVVGHYDCGGIKAALTTKNHSSPLENWIRNIRDVKRLHHAELTALPTFEEKFRRLVELNVVEQSLNVFKTWAVQQRRIETNKQMKRGLIKYTYPRVHGLVFSPSDGKLRSLPFREVLQGQEEALKDTYNLYDASLIPSSMSLPD